MRFSKIFQKKSQKNEKKVAKHLQVRKKCVTLHSL